MVLKVILKKIKIKEEREREPLTYTFVKITTIRKRKLKCQNRTPKLLADELDSCFLTGRTALKDVPTDETLEY